MSGEVLTDVTDGVGTITLNCPERLNALSRDLIDSLAAIVASLEVSGLGGPPSQAPEPTGSGAPSTHAPPMAA